MRRTLFVAVVAVLALGDLPAAHAAPPFDPGRLHGARVVPIPAGLGDSERFSERTVDPSDILSGVAFLRSDKARLLGFVPPRPPAPGPSGSGGVGPQGFTLADGSQYTVSVTNDTNQDVEPSVRTLTIGSTTYTTATSIKYAQIPPPSCPAEVSVCSRNFFATTTNFSTWTRGMLPMPAGYPESGDPLMDENSYTTGIAPLRVYTVGILLQANPDAHPNAIGVWHSDDGGQTWSQPTLAAVNSTDFIVLDKPAINVSQWSGNNGTVFIAYIKVDDHTGGTNSLLVQRSTDGGTTFSSPVLVATGNIEAPQILTSPFGDKVYVLWVDLTPNANAIRMSTSNSSLVTWTAAETAATGRFPGGNGGMSTFLNNGTGVRALTIPMARYNWATNSLGVVWHEFESPTSTMTDIYFVAKTSAGWQPKKRINPTTLNDQFMPGLDFDTSGLFMVTFYDRSQDPNNLLYKESWSRIDSLGNVVNSGALAAVPASNPCAYASSCSAPNAFIGDYQDSWWWTFSDSSGNRFNAVWTQQTSNTTGNIYVTGIQ